MVPDASRLRERFGGLAVFLNGFSCNLENHLKKAHFQSRQDHRRMHPGSLSADIP